MTDRTTYFGRELAETLDAEREAFIEQRIEVLVAQWPEIWTEPDKQSEVKNRT